MVVGGAGVGPDAGHMHERPRAGSLRGARDRLRAIGVDGLEALPPRLALDPAEVDDDLRALDDRLDRGGEAHIRLHRLHLPDHAVGRQEAREIRTAHRRAHRTFGSARRTLMQDAIGSLDSMRR